MKGLKMLFASGRKARMEVERKEELSYRVKLAEVRRQAEHMKRENERARGEAYRLEVAGDHEGAVSKALEAANSEKAYKTAVSTILRCESMHAQAKTQRSLTNLLSDCEAVSLSVMGQVDTEDAVKVQTRLQQTAAEMEQAQESMAAFQESFDPMADSPVTSSAGEDALAAILAERAPAAAPEPLPEKAEKAESAEKDDEWLREKRRQIAEMAG